MSLIPQRIEKAVLEVEASMMRSEQHVASMRNHLSRCEWRAASLEAERAVAAFEAHLDAMQRVYRTMARS